jgi:hypothetical protein
MPSYPHCDAGSVFVRVLEGNRIAWPMLQLNTHWNLFYGGNLRSAFPFNDDLTSTFAQLCLKSRYHLKWAIPQGGVLAAFQYEPSR